MTGGVSFGLLDLGLFSYEVRWSDRTALIDVGNDEVTQKEFFPWSSFDTEGWDTLQEALRRASFVVITHEHFDHVTGLFASPWFDEVAPHVRLPPAQLNSPHMQDAKMTDAHRARLTPWVVDGPTRLTDGVVVIPISALHRSDAGDTVSVLDGGELVTVPVEGLLDPKYVAERAKLITDKAGAAPPFGKPKGAPKVGDDKTHEPGGTTHFVVADTQGNVVSMTTTVESIFGNGRMVGGFFLNNQLTDFSFSPVEKDGAPAANAIAAGKRPRSSMSPLIVLDKKGKFLAAVGSPGGNAILSYNLKAMVGLFYWNLNMQQAVSLPNLVARGENFSGDADLFGPEMLAALNARGVTVKVGQLETSGLQGVIVRPGGVLEGGADPRREGVAKGL